MARDSPRKDPEEKLTASISLSLTEDLKSRLTEGALKENLPVQRLVREGAELRLRLKHLKIVEPKYVKAVPQLMTMPCGPEEDLESLIAEIGEDTELEVTDELADCVTEHSFAAKAKGFSMQDDEGPHSISPDDWLLMTPLDEYPRDVKNGDIVLAKIIQKSGAVLCTLKTYAGKQLKPRNPQYNPIDFGPDVKQVVVWAVARGKLRQQEKF